MINFCVKIVGLFGLFEICGSISIYFDLKILFLLKKCSKHIKLIKHTFNKLASILTRAHFVECRCHPGQDTIYRYKETVRIPKPIRSEILPTLEPVAIKIMNIIRSNEGTTLRQVFYSIYSISVNKTPVKFVLNDRLYKLFLSFQ